LDEDQPHQKKSILRYFIHGLLFSVLSLILGLASYFLLAVLLITGFIIGLVIGLILLFIIVGGVNTILTSYLWDIDIK
jgi:hypothetical protein